MIELDDSADDTLTVSNAESELLLSMLATIADSDASRCGLAVGDKYMRRSGG